MTELAAALIVKSILEELCSKVGFDDWWVSMDREVQLMIFARLVQLVQGDT